MSFLNQEVSVVWADLKRAVAAIKPRRAEELSLSVVVFLFLVLALGMRFADVRTAHYAAVYLAQQGSIAGTVSPVSARGMVLGESTSALTQPQIDAILSLLHSFGAEQSLVSKVESALAGGTTAPAATQWCHSFTTSLRIGNTGADVRNLVTVLNKEGLLNDKTDTFDEEVASAVTGFQEKYNNDVLAPVGLRYGTGFVGASTRAKLNRLYGCGVTPPPPAPVPPTSGVISEQVKCVFNGATTEEKCTGVGNYTTTSTGMELSPPYFSCSGIGTCVADVKGPSGMAVAWNSSCQDSKSPITRIDGQSEYANFSCVGTSSGIQVISPNGGESWQKGTTQTIKWQDTDKTPTLIARTYYLKLVPYYPPCTTTICPTYPYLAPYIIATGVSGASYSWNVGLTKGDTIAPDGAYTVQVCQTGTSTCDSSDSYFKIYLGTTQPSISYKVTPDKLLYALDEKIQILVSAINNSGETKTLNFTSGCQVYYSVASYDSRNGQVCTLALTSVTIPAYGVKTWTLTHDPSQYRIPVGQYKLLGGVIGYGEATTLITVGTTTQPSITVLYPNGGEVMTSGQGDNAGGAFTLKWNMNYIPKSLKLYLYKSDIGNVFSTPLPYSGIGVNSTRAPLWTEGKFKVTICDELTDNPSSPGKPLCDSSDSYFTITAPTTSTQPFIYTVAGMAAGNGEIDAGGKVGITGVNLAGYKDSSNVYIGGMVCTITQLSNTLIYCTAPSTLQVGSTYDLYINTIGMGGDKVTSNIVQVKVLSNVVQPSTGAVLGAETSASTLTQLQIDAVIGLLRSFGVEQGALNNVGTSLRGGVPSF